MNKIKVTFFPDNTNEKIYCYEMVLKMLLKHFIPNNEYNLEQLERITQKKRGQYSWSYSSYIFLLNLGFEIKTMSKFDKDKFITNGREYLKEYLGIEGYNIQDKCSDIDQGIAMLKDLEETIGNNPQLQKNYMTINSDPELNDIKSLIDDNYLIDCTINDAHSVLIYNYNNFGLFYHDPDNDSGEAKHLPFEIFNRIWRPKDIAAFRKQ